MNCNYCKIHYDMIGRVETFEKDLQYISTTTNNYKLYLSTTNNVKLQVHPSVIFLDSKSTYQSKTTTEEKTIRYFSTLNSTQLNYLYHLYQMDFEIFGYSVYPFVLNPNYNRI